MELSIVIVNFKTPDLIIDCIQSIKKTIKLNYEIIIVDNASGDNSQLLILDKFPDVKWIQMSYNAGFSRANNAGIKIANGEYVLLLNSDTIILDNSLDRMHFFMQQNPNAVAGSVQLLNADSSPQNAGNYFVIGGINILLTLPILDSISRNIGQFFRIKKPSILQSNAINNVDWISGAFMFVRKSIVKNAGYMDEDFFLFSEEIEWCSRLKKEGDILVNTNIKVIHLEGGTTKKLTTKDVKSYYEYWTPKGHQLMVSHLLRIRKQYNVFWMFINYLIFCKEITVLFLGVIFSSKYTFKMAFQYAKYVLETIKYLPKIISNKPYFYKVI